MTVGTSEYEHHFLVPAQIHAIGFVQDSDPGALGNGNANNAFGKVWLDTSGGTGNWRLKVRNATDTGWELIASGLGGVPAIKFDARLTLTTGSPYPTGDVTGATSVFLTSLNGNKVSVYTSGGWVTRTLSADISIKLTDTQNGTTSSGSPIITALSDTSQFIVGMEVTGTNIPASSVINSIDSATQVTINNNATGSGTVSLTFKVPVTTALDFFVFDNAGTLKLEMLKWTSANVRVALTKQDGYWVKGSDATRLHVGSGLTILNAGQIEDTSVGNRNLWNRYNRALRTLRVSSTSSHSYTSTSFRRWNTNIAVARWFAGDTIDAYKAEFAGIVDGGGATGKLGIGVNSTTTPTGINPQNAVNGSKITVGGAISQTPVLGQNFLTVLEAGGTTCLFDDAWLEATITA